MKKTIVYIITTCLISWAFAGICIALLNIREGIGFQVMGMAYMLLPAIVAFCLQKFIYKKPLKNEFKISFKFNKWFIIAIVTPLFIVFFSILIGLLFPEVHFSKDLEGYFYRYADQLGEDQLLMMKEQMSEIPSFLFPILVIFSSIIAGCTINSVFAFGEELGWRGYMLYYLRKFSFVKVSVFTGIVWGFWHFPLILMGHNYPQHPVIGVIFMVIFCILFSFISTYIVIKSNSVITAALIHGNFNAVAGLPILYLVGGNDLTIGVTGIAGFIAMIVIISGLFIYDKYISKENIFVKSIAS